MHAKQLDVIFNWQDFYTSDYFFKLNISVTEKAHDMNKFSLILIQFQFPIFKIIGKLNQKYV